MSDDRTETGQAYTDEPGIDALDTVTEEEPARETEQAEAELAELRDKLLRAYAEMDNVRKRARRDVEEARKFGIERFATELLDVIDNLERALASTEGGEQSLREGVQLTLNHWHKVMHKFGLERIEALGKHFDPHLHEAMAQIPHGEKAGKIVAQHSVGYAMHGRLLRPARVVVSSGPAAAEGKHAKKSAEGKR